MKLLLPLLGAALLAATPARTDSSPRVVARKGPIEIWLELKASRIKVGERIRFKAGLRNVSRAPAIVTTGFLSNIEDLGELSRFRKFTFVLVQRPDSRTLEPVPYLFGGSDICIERSTAPFVNRSDEDAERPSLVRRLAPGASVQTPPWERSKWRGCTEIPGVPTDQFAELWPFDFDTKGEYRLKFVYDDVPYLPSERKRKRRPEEVRVETDWIMLEVG